MSEETLRRDLETVITEAWRRGWQPADLPRVVRRAFSAAHARIAVAAIAAEARLYARATLDARWRAQLDELDVEHVGWEAVDVKAAHETLLVLRLLPSQPVLIPRPWETPRVRSAGQTDARMLERVRALLAKAESTTFPAEAEALTAKAQELMARHRLDRAMIEASEESFGPSGRRLGIDDPYASAKFKLLAVVAYANRCKAVLSKGFGFATVFGFEADLDAVELLYTSLLLQADTAMAAEGRRARHARMRSFRQSFLIAYATRIGERLHAVAASAEAEAVATHGESLLPVLVAREDAVEGARRAAFPKLATFSARASDPCGWAAGRAAADLASLSPHMEVGRPRSA